MGDVLLDTKVLIEKTDLDAANEVMINLDIEKMPVEKTPDGQRRGDGTDDIFALAYQKNQYSDNYDTHVLRTGDPNNKHYLGGKDDTNHDWDQRASEYLLVYGNLDRIMSRLLEKFPNPSKDTILIEENWVDNHQGGWYNPEWMTQQERDEYHKNREKYKPIFQGVTIYKRPCYKGSDAARAKALAKRFGSIIWTGWKHTKHKRMKAPFYHVGSNVIRYDPNRHKKDAASASKGKFLHGDLRGLLAELNYALHKDFKCDHTGWGFFANSGYDRPNYDQLLKIVGACLDITLAAMPKLTPALKKWLKLNEAKVFGLMATKPDHMTSKALAKACLAARLYKKK